MSYTVSWKTHGICILIALAITNIFGDGSNIIVENFILQKFICYPTKYLLLNFYLYILLIMIPISIIHEGIHGFMYKLFGGYIKYGFKGLYAYTQEISGLPIERTKFLIILLSPLVLISVLSLFLPAWLGGIIFFLNLLGSVGDLYMSLLVATYNADCRIVDRSYGFDVHYV